MNKQQLLVFQLNLPVRWADMDVNAHVNNTRFFTYFESARLAWFESAGARNQRNGRGFVVAQASCNYRRPISYPETLRVDLYAGAAGRSSFTTYYRLLSAADPAFNYADGQAVMVWVNRTTGKARPLPDFVRALLAPVHPRQ